MIKQILKSIAASTRLVFKRWPAALLLLLIDGALAAATYLFFSTREATVGQVLLSLMLPLLAVMLFFVLQTMIARLGSEANTPRLIAESLRDFWKLILISIPIIAVAWLIIYVAGRIEESFTPAVQQATRTLPAKPRNPVRPAGSSVPWQVTLTTTVKYVLLLVAIPLAAVHLWLRTAREGLKIAVKTSGRLLGHAFGARSVLVYALGFVVFGVLPYFLLFTRTPANNAWVEAGFLGARLLIAGLLSLIGWAITVCALGDLRAETSTADELHQGTEHAPVAT
jgi:hypothetical protein